MKRNSDSDYKAQDEGSGLETPSRKKNYKKTVPKMNKKQIFSIMSQGFLPQGVLMDKQNPLSEQQYKNLIKLDDAPQFTLNFKTFIGKICKVIDGDTVKAIIYLNQTPTRFTFRIDGVDTPEMKKGQTKDFGKYVKTVISDLIEKRIVKIEAGSFDKYGRVLCRIYFKSQGQQICLNEFLIQNDLAKPYFGKTKSQFVLQDWKDFQEKYADVKWPKVTDYPIK